MILLMLSTTSFPINSKKLTRKRKVKKKDWMTEKQKRACQAGKAYVNWKKQVIPAKQVSINVLRRWTKKRNKQYLMVLINLRKQQRNYIFTIPQCVNVARQTKTDEGDNFKSTNRQNSYSYYLQPEEGIKIKSW